MEMGMARDNFVVVLTLLLGRVEVTNPSCV